MFDARALTLERDEPHRSLAPRRGNSHC